MSLKLGIVLSLDGTETVSRGLGDVGNKVENVGTKVRSSGKDLENSMGGIGAQLERMKTYLLGFVVFDKLAEYAGKAINLADSWNILNGKIKLATTSSAEAAQVTQQLYGLAQQLRVPLAETATLYGRLVPALKEYGGGTAEALRITDALALSLKISGASQAESASAMLQFSQAMSAGALRGEEFNSMADAAPRLLQALAAGMGKTRGELKGLAEQGQLTTDVVYAALSKQLPQLEKEFSQLPLTVGDAWTKLSNASMKAIGEFDRGAGITSMLADSLSKLADHVPTIVDGIVRITEVSIAYFGLVKGAPLLLGAFSVALGAVQGAMVQWQLGAATGATTWQLLNVSLTATPLAAAPAITALTALKIAGGVLFAAFAGWQIGTWLYDNFAWAREAGLAFVGSMLKGWEWLKFGALAAWEGIKFGFLSVGDFIRKIWAEEIDFIASAAEKVGATGLAEKLRGWSDGLAQSSTSADQLKSRLDELSASRDKEINLIDDTITDMYRDEAQRGKVTSATQKQQQAADKLKTTTKLSADEQKKLATTTEKLKDNIDEHIDALKRQLVGQDKMSDSEKLATQIQELLTKQGKNLTEAERQYFQGKLQLLPQLDSQVAAQKRLSDAQEAHTKKLEDGLKAMQDELEAAITERESIGRTESQVKALQVARDRETLAMLQAKQAREGCSKELDHEIEVVQQRIAVGEKLVAQLEDNSAFKKQQEQIQENTEKWTQFADDIGRDFTDGFQRMLEDGRSGWDSFTASIKNTFEKTVVEWIYNAFAKPIIVNLVSSMSGGNSGGGGLLSLVGSGSSMSGVFGSGAGTTAGAGTGSAFGGLSSSAMGWAALIAIGAMMSDSAYSKGFNEDTFSYTDAWLKTAGIAPVTMKADTKLLQKLGLDKHTSNVITGASLWSNAFGSSKKKVTGGGIEGTFSGDDFAGQNYATWKKKGGWFKSDKKGTDYSALDTETDEGLGSTFSALRVGMAGYAKSLGLATNYLNSYSKQVKIELTDDDAANEQKLNDLFAGMANEMANGLLPNLAQFSKDGETAAGTIQRLAATFDVTNAAASLLGGSWERVYGQIDITSANARDALVSLSGGIDAFSQKVSFYYENFYTQEEKNARSFAELDSKLDQLGVTLDLSTGAFRDLMDSDRISGDAALQAALLDIAPLFSSVIQNLGDAAAGKIIGVGIDATGLSDKQLADINQSAKSWFENYQPEIKAQTDQAAKTTDAIVNLTSVSAAASEAIRTEIANGNTQLATVINSIQSAGMSAEATGRAIAAALDALGKSTVSAVESAVLSNDRL